MNPRDITLSYHFTTDRKERLHEINWVLMNDWGLTIYKVWNSERKAWIHITNTGLYFVTSEDESCIVTMFIPSISQVYRLFAEHGAKMPYELKQKIHQNDKLVREYEENFFKKSA